MRFAIRDDDTNYFTKPEQIEFLYGKLWTHIPVSLAVVPFQFSANAGGGVPAKYSVTDAIYPLGENLELVQYLRHHLEAGHIEIMLHGYHHRKDENGLPEFLLGSDSDKKIREGKQYLESLFGVKIDTFVPPWNSLSRNGFEAVVNERLNLLGFFSLRSSQRAFEFSNVLNFMRMRLFRLKTRIKGNLEISYPYVQTFARHKEFVCYGLVGATAKHKLTSALDLAYRMNGDFCLTTHYWELIKIPALRELLYGFIEHAEQYTGIEFSAVHSLWEQ